MPPIEARANVLGVGISAIDMTEAVRLAGERVRARRKGYICVTGAHGIIEAQRDPCLREILNSAFLCTPDGTPTVWVARLQGHRRIRRVYGPDLMLELCRMSVERGYRHFLYGGADGVADRLQRALKQCLPGIQIVGSFTPPFRPLEEEEERQLIRQVAHSRPDIIWVGISTPKQEYFMAEMLPRLDTTLMIGVGAAFDIHAGLRTDAPGWIKRGGLQWLYRLSQEPRRLWRRYFDIVPHFMWNVALQLAGCKRFPMNPCSSDRR